MRSASRRERGGSPVKESAESVGSDGRRNALERFHSPRRYLNCREGPQPYTAGGHRSMNKTAYMTRLRDTLATDGPPPKAGGSSRANCGQSVLLYDRMTPLMRNRFLAAAGLRNRGSNTHQPVSSPMKWPTRLQVVIPLRLQLYSLPPLEKPLTMDRPGCPFRRVRRTHRRGNTNRAGGRATARAVQGDGTSLIQRYGSGGQGSRGSLGFSTFTQAGLL